MNTFSFLAQIAARRRWRSPHWVSVSGQWVSVGPTRSFFFAFKEKTVGGKLQFGWPFNNFFLSHIIPNVLQSSCLGPTLLYSMSHIALTVVHLLGSKVGLIMHGLIYPLYSLLIECAEYKYYLRIFVESRTLFGPN